MTRSPQSAQPPTASGHGAMVLIAAIALLCACEEERLALAPATDTPATADAAPATDAGSGTNAAAVPVAAMGADTGAPSVALAPEAAPPVLQQPAAKSVAAVESPPPAPALAPAPTPDTEPEPAVPTAPAMTTAMTTAAATTTTRKPMSQLTLAQKKVLAVHQRVTKQVEVLDGLSAAKSELRESLGYLNQAIRVLHGAEREEAETILDEVRASLVEADEIHRELRAEVDVALEQSERDIPAGY